MFPPDYDPKRDPLPSLVKRLSGYAVGLASLGFLLWVVLSGH